MALQGFAVWWEEKEMHINQAVGTPKGQLSDTGQCGGSSAWVGMVGLERQEVEKCLRADEWIRSLC